MYPFENIGYMRLISVKPQISSLEDKSPEYKKYLGKIITYFQKDLLHTIATSMADKSTSITEADKDYVMKSIIRIANVKTMDQLFRLFCGKHSLFETDVDPEIIHKRITKLLSKYKK
jgi:hypothetical protein